jgi:pimeloyl-ACP methyl ester carboxylesterase
MQRTLPDCDVEVIKRPDIEARLRADFTRPLSSTAGRATVQDIQLEHKPWGFSLRDITIRVHVWHGDADTGVVVANGVYQADEIPNATLHRLPDEGHWLLFSHFDEVLDCVTM